MDDKVLQVITPKGHEDRVPRFATDKLYKAFSAVSFALIRAVLSGAEWVGLARLGCGCLSDETRAWMCGDTQLFPSTDPAPSPSFVALRILIPALRRAAMSFLSAWTHVWDGPLLKRCPKK